MNAFEKFAFTSERNLAHPSVTGLELKYPFHFIEVFYLIRMELLKSK